MNEIYLWCVTGMAGLLALNTLWRLWTERERLGKEDLSDEDRSLAWRIVIFLIFPLLVYLDLRATVVSCDWLGGYIRSWSYGLFWYHAVPAALPDQNALLFVSFAGAFTQLILAVCLLPSLLFRPHPFLSTLIGYSCTFIFALNLILDPLLSLAGLGSQRWALAYTMGSVQDRLILLVVHLLAASIFLAIMLSQRIRLCFSGLSRPQASDELKKALSEWKARPDSARLMCRVGLLYDRAGLRRRSRRQLKKLIECYPDTLYSRFLEAVLAYRRRQYKLARQAFLLSSEFPGVDGILKASLLSASGCAAFADADITGALNLSERALEFDDACLVARMVKVDVFLRQGKKEQAGEEILFAMRLGLTLDLENKVPLDTERVFDMIARLEDRCGTPSYRFPVELPR